MTCVLACGAFLTDDVVLPMPTSPHPQINQFFEGGPTKAIEIFGTFLPSSSNFFVSYMLARCGLGLCFVVWGTGVGCGSSQSSLEVIQYLSAGAS